MHLMLHVVQPLVYRFDDEEWDNVIVKDADWTRHETEYLLDLCKQFQLRFLIIADQYEVHLPTLDVAALACCQLQRSFGMSHAFCCKTFPIASCRYHLKEAASSSISPWPSIILV